MEINYIRFKYILDLLKMMISFSGKSTRNKAIGFHGMHKKKDFWRFLKQIQILLIHGFSLDMIHKNGEIVHTLLEGKGPWYPTVNQARTSPLR